MSIFKENRLVLATHNRGKILELSDLLAETGIQVCCAADFLLEEPAEIGQTFEENAETKARFVAEATGFYALSDDSGLVVEALDGAPGVYSADWAIDETGTRDFAMAMKKVEDALEMRDAVTEEQRKASFVSVLCLCSPEGKIQFFKGEVCGHIVSPPRGELGFGFDPIFQPEGEERTFGEMSAAEKHGWKMKKDEARSHRARAFKAFFEGLGLDKIRK